MQPLTVLSPHFDDGVLSCGGQIWETGRMGGAVRVITLFAGASPVPVPPFAEVQHRMWGDPPFPTALRRAEDHAAYLRLGCQDVHHLPVPDAVYRLSGTGTARYGSEDAIFGPVHAEEEGASPVLADLVRPLVLAGGPLLAPLGVGNHVDHTLTHLAARLLEESDLEVVYYEELPYVEQPQASTAITARTRGWRAGIVAMGAGAMDAKVAAMAYYHTQVPVLYGSIDEMERRLRAVAMTAGEGNGYAERRWWRQDG